MLTGSLVSSFQGAPRATHDIDLVVTISAAEIPRLLSAFPTPDYYLDEQAAGSAIASGGHFNLLDVVEGDKVDFWLLTNSSFDQSRFARRIVEDVEGLTVCVSTPEDTILQKLKWATEGGIFSERQFRDAIGVFELQAARLDRTYMDRWAAALGVEELWRKLQAEAKPL
jgi:hypothetical protein